MDLLDIVVLQRIARDRDQVPITAAIAERRAGSAAPLGLRVSERIDLRIDALKPTGLSSIR
jgi:hypothetical protein